MAMKSFSLSQPSRIHGVVLSKPQYSRSQRRALQAPSETLAARNNVQNANQGNRRRRGCGLLLTTGVVMLGIYSYDRQYKYSTLTRNFRAVSTFAVVAVDSQVQRLLGEYGDEKLLQQRNIERFTKMFQANGGIYQKFGQTIALQSTTMSPEMRARFAIFYDECPPVSLDEIAKVLQVDFDLPSTASSPEAVFDSLFLPGSFESKPVGVASIAQVHKARLKDTGEAVAVKIQKPAIKQQLSWDLWVLATMTSLFAKNIPESFRTTLTNFFTDRIMSETDFVNEVSNAEHLRERILEEPRLRDVVHVPKTYSALSTRRVMVAEWIDGYSIREAEILTSPWKNDASIGSPITKKDSPDITEEQDVYGLGLRGRDVMSVMLDLSCAQTFLFGQVHCDPHPGNILIRRLANGKPQLVLLDHGLYVSITPKLRRELALFWRSLLTFDRTTLLQIAEAWGFGDVAMLSKSLTLESMQTARKVFMNAAGEIEGRSETSSPDAERAPQFRLFARPKSHAMNPDDFIADADKVPQELIFIIRHFRIVQGNNRLLGTPVDRLKIIGRWAQASLARDEAENREKGVLGWVKRVWREGVFRIVLWGLPVVGWVGELNGVWGRGAERGAERGA